MTTLLLCKNLLTFYLLEVSAVSTTSKNLKESEEIKMITLNKYEDK